MFNEDTTQQHSRLSSMEESDLQVTSDLARDELPDQPTPVTEKNSKDEGSATGTSTAPVMSGIWNAWSMVSAQATNLLREAEQYKAIDKARELGIGIANRAAEGLGQVMDALDPMGGLGESSEMKIIVMSAEPTVVKAVEAAASTVFPLADVYVSGVTVSSDIAEQPVGFAAGLKGAQNRLANSEYFAGKVAGYENALLVSIENFIVEIEGCWYDMACVMMKNEAKQLTHTAYSQAVAVPTEYVDIAMVATSPSYPHRATGLEMSIGQAIHSEKHSISPMDWQSSFTNNHMPRSTQIEHCVTAVLGEYLVAVNNRAAITQQPTMTQ